MRKPEPLTHGDLVVAVAIIIIALAVFTFMSEYRITQRIEQKVNQCQP